MPRTSLQTKENHSRMLGLLAMERAGLLPSIVRTDRLIRRVTPRLRVLGMQDLAEYLHLVESQRGIHEFGAMVHALTAGRPRFFREPEHFDHLCATVMPSLIRKGRARFWSAGCGNGMEPYSLAMALYVAHGNLTRRDVRILATDIDPASLEVARTATYPIGDLSRLSIPDAFRCYARIRERRSTTLAPEITAPVTFREHNLLDPWTMKGPFDAIFCRSVASYMTRETRRRLYDRFADILAPDGWLYIGHPESLQGLSDRFECVRSTIYRRVR